MVVQDARLAGNPAGFLPVRAGIAVHESLGELFDGRRLLLRFDGGIGMHELLIPLSLATFPPPLGGGLCTHRRPATLPLLRLVGQDDANIDLPATTTIRSYSYAHQGDLGFPLIGA